MQPIDVLKQYYEFATFRSQQLSVIERVIGGGHALVIMPTGMGKSLCYQIPAIIHAADKDMSRRGGPRGLTLVISPLIALMKDQVDALVARGIDATFINSSLSREDREARYNTLSEGAHQLLYVTPERFRNPEFREAIGHRRIDLLAVDEAHCISQWGHDFRPDYSRIGEFRRLLGDPTTIALTATATPEVQIDIISQLGLDAAEIKVFHEGIDRPNLELCVEHAWGEQQKLEHLNRIRSRGLSRGGSGIVYFTLIKTLERFSDQLHGQGAPHLCYHGDLDRDERRRVQNEFMEAEGALVLATNAFGMGIDKEDIRFVIHADVPGSMESYYQEIGRAGRDGKPSQCMLLYDQRDLTTQTEFLQWSNPSADFYQRVYLFLTADEERLRAFGLDWLRQQLHPRGQRDHRLETALSMLDRYDVIRDRQAPGCFDVLADLPEALADDERLQAKTQRDQRRLYALVQYVRYTGDRKRFIHEYFGLPYDGCQEHVP